MNGKITIGAQIMEKKECRYFTNLRLLQQDSEDKCSPHSVNQAMTTDDTTSSSLTWNVNLTMFDTTELTPIDEQARLTNFGPGWL